MARTQHRHCVLGRGVVWEAPPPRCIRGARGRRARGLWLCWTADTLGATSTFTFVVVVVVVVGAAVGLLVGPVAGGEAVLPPNPAPRRARSHTRVHVRVTGKKGSSIRQRFYENLPRHYSPPESAGAFVSGPGGTRRQRTRKARRRVGGVVGVRAGGRAGRVRGATRNAPSLRNMTPLEVREGVHGESALPPLKSLSGHQ